MSVEQWAARTTEEILDRCAQLAELTSMENGIEHGYLSPQMGQTYGSTAG